jgi:hypothetical protein
MKSFLSRFSGFVLFVLSGFDRLRLCGESRLLNHAGGLESYLWQQHVLFKDFPDHAAKLTHSLRRQTEALAKEHGVPFKHLDSPKIDKEATALQLAAAGHSTPQGRIAVLSCVESCSTYRLRKNAEGLIAPRKEAGKCTHYYHYFQHPRLGLCYVRIQTWFPFRVHVGINGREWLFQQLRQQNIPFQHRGNLLLRVQDPAKAQALLDEQLRTDWPAMLQELVEPIHPLWSYLHTSVHTPYYWMAEQSEWATDVTFHSPDFMAKWYPRFLRHGIETLSCKDVLRYLGKKVPEHGYGRCSHEAKIDLRTRTEGARLKFWYGTNSVKAYDKEALTAKDQEALLAEALEALIANVLRIETTVNDPSMFQVFRPKEGAPEDAPKSWQQMRKGVADLERRAEVSQAANNRLLESFATVADTTPLGKLVEPLCKPTTNAKGRRVRALNPLGEADGALLRCVAQGEFLVNGFRNRDLRTALHSNTADAKEQRKQSAAITRKLALLKAHGLIVKVQKTHRYQLSAAGKRITAALETAKQADITRLAEPT